jgi:REP element-mobilizing transposase RayT
MRPSRFAVLSQPSGIVHLFWRCHNREFLLKGFQSKWLYFQSLIRGLMHRGTNGSVKLHAFCLMDNHTHQQVSYENGASKLSHYMRVANGIFGQAFNKVFKRSGKVANERPKTPPIGDIAAQIRVHIYIETNPIRAKIAKLEMLRFLKWTSYRFYAYGIVDEWTQHLTHPQWYLDLAKTPEQRQVAYRRMVRAALKEENPRNPERKIFNFLGRFIGTSDWVKEQEKALRARLSVLRNSSTGARASPVLC